MNVKVVLETERRLSARCYDTVKLHTGDVTVSR